MEEYFLENNLKLIYKHTESELTSICIALDAGAGVETEKYGIAHATEHMVYKGTEKRTEKEINKDLSNVFGFNNAMTNYPYVIYYGTLLGEELEKGVDLLSDIIINPTFSNNGFKEEMDVIKEELNEWDEELEQFCEDTLFFNCFNRRRIKYPIIGTKESLDDITLNDIKEFYAKYYFPDNASIVIISSIKFEAVKKIVNQYFGKWFSRLNEKGERNKIKKIEYEIPKQDVFRNKRGKSQTCKIEMISPIDSLNDKEIKALRIFNQYFGDGINSVLYEALRTENGIIYDVNTRISNENYIKLYKITFNTAEKNINKAISIVKECISKLDSLEQNIDKEYIYQLTKNFKLKKLFKEEQSIVLAKELATYDSMFGDYKIYIDESSDLDLITSEMIFEVGRNVLKNLSTQIIYQGRLVCII